MHENRRKTGVFGSRKRKLLGCTLDDLSAAEFEFLTKVVNYEL